LREISLEDKLWSEKDAHRIYNAVNVDEKQHTADIRGTYIKVQSYNFTRHNREN